MAELEELKRVNYFTGQLLDANLFQLEQNYSTQLVTDHNLNLFTSGVASGLEVTAMGGTVFSIGTGMAIDTLGRQLVWPCGGPSQTLPSECCCQGSGDSEKVEVFLAWQETLVCESCQQPPNCSVVSLLPAIVYNIADTDPVLKIATLTVQGGAIVAVDNSKTFVSLKVSSQEQAPQASPVSAGSADFTLSLRPNDLVWKRINYRSDGKPAFTSLPIVTVSPVSQDLSIYGLTLNSITTVGFNVGISWLAGEGHNPQQTYPITINWQALTPRVSSATGDPYAT